MNFLQAILLPVSLLYGIVVSIRNLCFDLKILPGSKYKKPIISVGNLCAGGAGKTPQVEYLIRLLQENNLKVAILSRGYKRKTKGFLHAGPKTSIEELGDEVWQINNKFDNLIVAVDEKRTRGISTLLEMHDDIDVILLDDAYQHRSVKPGLSILLTDFHHLFTKDFMLPSGRLREPSWNYKRADIIIVTKTNRVLSPITQRGLNEEIKPKPYQELHFSYIKYGPFISLTGEESLDNKKSFSLILLIAGIANPYPLEFHLKNYCTQLDTLSFKDHHWFTPKDGQMIRDYFQNTVTKNKIVVTTEKDAARLRKSDIFEFIKDLPVYYIPISTMIHEPGKSLFDKKILDYVKRSN
ncbi:MAG: tetraacyldisaccharide 4'-kinase [Bacteroidales bacterium]|nr:tetraacyldisaccharide 4'-kinase [Bacteroidales bacterium]